MPSSMSRRSLFFIEPMSQHCRSVCFSAPMETLLVESVSVSRYTCCNISISLSLSSCSRVALWRFLSFSRREMCVSRKMAGTMDTEDTERKINTRKKNNIKGFSAITSSATAVHPSMVINLKRDHMELLRSVNMAVEPISMSLSHSRCVARMAKTKMQSSMISAKLRISFAVITMTWSTTERNFMAWKIRNIRDTLKIRTARALLLLTPRNKNVRILTKPTVVTRKSKKFQAVSRGEPQKNAFKLPWSATLMQSSRVKKMVKPISNCSK
mmetsp:Transcript_146525/g.408207  ORF Transcript_146525/g.408207 Transcript_146525/m.408207 type:complete len:269 (+) Transcript_146525:367-1173(+)